MKGVTHKSTRKTDAFEGNNYFDSMWDEDDKEKDFLSTFKIKTEKETTCANEDTEENAAVKDEVYFPLLVNLCVKSESEDHNLVIKEEPPEYREPEFFACDDRKSEIKQEHTTDTVPSFKNVPQGELSENEEDIDIVSQYQDASTSSEVGSVRNCNSKSGLKQNTSNSGSVRPSSCSNSVPATRVHTSEWLYICPVCNKPFKEKYKLKSHSRCHKTEFERKSSCSRIIEKDEIVLPTRIHTGELVYICSVCNKGFTEKYKLVSHHSRCHRTEFERKSSCSKMIDKDKIVLPTRIHTGELVYICSVCNKGFKEKYKLIRHSRNHESQLRYCCNVCNKSFKQKSNLVAHTRIHTGEQPYRCAVCSRGFKQLSHLIDHSQIHTGELPYVCTICNKGFKQRPHLDEHSRVHKTGLSYTCSVCNRGFCL